MARCAANELQISSTSDVLVDSASHLLSTTISHTRAGRLRRVASWYEHDRQRADALGTVYEHPLNVGSCRWSAVKTSIVRRAELGLHVGVLGALDDIGRVEEYNQVLGQVCKGIDLQFFFSEKYGPGLSDGESGAYDSNVHLGQFAGLHHRHQGDIPADFRYGRTNGAAPGQADTQGLKQVAGGILLHDFAAHQLQVIDKSRLRTFGPGPGEVGHGGKVVLSGRTIGSDPGKDRGARAHHSSPLLPFIRFRFHHEWKVSFGASGISRFVVHVLSGL